MKPQNDKTIGSNYSKIKKRQSKFDDFFAADLIGSGETDIIHKKEKNLRKLDKWQRLRKVNITQQFDII